jgi:peptidoglycan/xylan/chitin deacetylase (PgdA/CDA1 family)
MDNQLYDYSPIIHRPKLELPNGARLAFWVGLNVEHYEIDKPATSIFSGTAMLQPDPLNYGWRDYGPRVGIWRMMDVLDKHGMRASVLLNADVCRYYPQIIAEGNKRGWVWLAHGKNNSIFEAGMALEEERAYLTDVVRGIEQGTGQRPKGWLGPALTETFNTPELLAELGLTYLLDWCNDDQPFPLNVKAGRMISVPYSIEMNDISLFVGKSLSGQDFAQEVMDQFDVLYEEGGHNARVMCLALHPFVVNQPFRHKYLDKALEYIAGHEGVWLTTSDEIAEWYLATGPSVVSSQPSATRAGPSR